MASSNSSNGSGSVLHRENYAWMLAGVVVIIIGFLLMVGGAPKDPDVFDPDTVYSFRRITLAPLVVILGFVIEIAAIFRRPNKA